MQLSVLSFDFAGDDRAAEERHYFDFHVRVARELPGLALYLTGKLVDHPRHRAAVIAFESGEAMAAAMGGDDGDALKADTRAHMTRITSETAAARELLPFDGRERGLPCAAVVAAHDGDERGVDQVAGARAVIVGSCMQLGRTPPEHTRLEIAIYDDLASLRAGYQPPAGARVWVMDARVER